MSALPRFGPPGIMKSALYCLYLRHLKVINQLISWYCFEWGVTRKEDFQMQAAVPPANSAAGEVLLTEGPVFPGDQLLVICLGRHPCDAVSAIVNSELGRNLKAHGFDPQPAWARGAVVLVAGLSLDVFGKMDFSEAELQSADDLKSYHVICRPEDETKVLACMRGLRYKKRPRAKKITLVRLYWPLDLADVGDASSCKHSRLLGEVGGSDSVGVACTGDEGNTELIDPTATSPVVTRLR